MRMYRALTGAVLLAGFASGTWAAKTQTAPKLTLSCAAKHGLVDDADTTTVTIKLSAPGKALEVRTSVTDWSGKVTRTKADVAAGSPWSGRVEVKLPRFGPYEFSAELFEPGGKVALNKARRGIVRVLPVTKLSAKQRARSSIAVNTHFNAPWDAFAKMGIHWARDYCWGWLGFGEKAPAASNGVVFTGIVQGAEAAGITILPCMQGPFRSKDQKRFLGDAARIRDAYERLSKVFPSIPFWELDNEMDLKYSGDPVGFEAMLPSYHQYIRSAAEGLRRAGKGAKVALNGDSGIYHERTKRLLKSPAGADFAICNFHYYTGTVPPELARGNDNTTVGTHAKGLAFLDDLRQISRLAHDHGREAWLTEVGWDVTYGPAVGVRLQAIYLARMYLLARHCGVDKVFWFFDRDSKKGTGVFASCGLLDLTGSARPSAGALAAVSKLTALAEYAGEIDLGPDRWCLLFRTPEGPWVAAAWTVRKDHPIPDSLKGARRLDLFGNPAKSDRLTGEVAYFLFDKPPAGWDQQRQAEWISRRTFRGSPGESVTLEARLPKGARLSWQSVPKGVVPGKTTTAKGLTRTVIALPPTLAVGRHPLTAQVQGSGWQHRWRLTVQVDPPLVISPTPYKHGHGVTVRIRPAGDEPVEVTFDAGKTGRVSPAKLTVPPKGTTFRYYVDRGAKGATQVVARLSSGATQTFTFRPGTLHVAQVKDIRLDGKLDDWSADSKLDEGIFVASDPNFATALHLGWSPEGLWLAMRAPAKGLRGEALPEQFWEWSNVELFVDTSGQAHDDWPASSHQFWLLPARKGKTWATSVGQWKRGPAIAKTIFDDKRCKSAIHVADGLYTMEMFVPSRVLGAIPGSGPAWRMAIATQTDRLHGPKATTGWPRGKSKSVLNGSRLWGEILFAGGAKTTRPSVWESTIAGFEKRDLEKPPPRHAILFVGSSSIRGWDTRKYFPKIQTIQRGFGGSQVCDSFEYAGRIILPYQPRVVVVYAGDNDIAAGKSPQRVLEDYTALVRRIHDDLPKARIVYIAIKPSIARWRLVGKMRAANQLIETFTKTDERLRYVDIDKPMIGPAGRPRKELFARDGLHLSHEGYVLWTSLVRPHLSE